MNFGREIWRRRKAAGLTLEELAEAADLTPNYLSTLEVPSGKARDKRRPRDPSLSTICALAKGLGVHPSELLGGHAPRVEADPESLEGAVLLSQLAPEVRSRAVELLRALAQPAAALPPRRKR